MVRVADQILVADIFVAVYTTFGSTMIIVE